MKKKYKRIFIDLVGQQFNKWLVLKFVGRKNGNIFWKCQCLCGFIKNVEEQLLVNGRSKGCRYCHWVDKYNNGYTNPMLGKNRPDVAEWNKCNLRSIKRGPRPLEVRHKIGETQKKHIAEGKIIVKRGSDHPSWRGGVSKAPYPFEFDKELKLQILTRDGFICKVCKIPHEEEFQGLTVHHIDYDKSNCNPNNLVTLCHACNSRANGSRNVWRKYFARENTALRDFVGWEQIQNECREIKKFLLPKNITGVVPILRGGVPIATMLSFMLKVPLKTEVELNTDVIIDDVVDFGITINRWKRKYPNNLFISLYFNSKNFRMKIKPDFYVKIIDKYIVFPWELDPSLDNFNQFISTNKTRPRKKK